MKLHEYLRVLRERWLLIVVGLVMGVLGAGVTTHFMPRQYASSAVLYVSAQSQAGNASEAYEGGLLSQQRIKSYTQLMSSQRLAADVIANLGLKTSPAALANRISVASGVETVLLTVTVRDDAPDQAARVANGVADSFIRLVSQLEQPEDPKRSPPVAVRVVQAAVPAATPVTPRPSLNYALGALVGILAGLGAAFLRNALDTTIRSPEQLREITGAPNIGVIGLDPAAARHPLTLQDDFQAPRAEAFRQLRTNLQFVDVDRRRKVIIVTSAVAGEGKSTTMCNLAIAAAAAGYRVLAVDADLRRPMVAKYLGLESAVGLTTVLSGRVGFEESLQRWGGVMDVLATGPIPPNPSELLSSRVAADLLNHARQAYDLVLIDTPPLLPVTDAAALSPAGDGVMLVVRFGKTTKAQLKLASEALAAVSASVLGTVSSMVPMKGPGGYGDYRTYYPTERPVVYQARDERLRPNAAVVTPRALTGDVPAWHAPEEVRAGWPPNGASRGEPPRSAPPGSPRHTP